MVDHGAINKIVTKVLRHTIKNRITKGKLTTAQSSLVTLHETFRQSLIGFQPPHPNLIEKWQASALPLNSSRSLFLSAVPELAIISIGEGEAL